MDVKQAQQEIKTIIAKLENLHDALNVNESAVTMAAIEEPQKTNTYVDQLIERLHSDQWPYAAHPNMICDPNDDKEKFDRGRGMIELMVEKDVLNAKFLDFGCGEAHAVAYAASKGAALAVGYDINNTGWDRIDRKDNLFLTTHWNEVMEKGPFDIILSFDVFDHLEGGETLDQAYQKMSDALVPGGVAYVRHHPFTSKHALHTYHELNKAYVHLVFTQEELEPLIKDLKHAIPNAGVVSPILTYEGLAKKSGLNICNRRDIKDHVDEFFKSPTIKERITKNVGHDFYPDFQMSIQFLDFVYQKPVIDNKN